MAPMVRAMTFTTLVVGNLALIFVNRSWTHTMLGGLLRRRGGATSGRRDERGGESDVEDPVRLHVYHSLLRSALRLSTDCDGEADR